MIADWTWVQLLTTVSGLYALGIAVFLIRDNRSPQSTFAWLFLMLVFPIGGVIIYTLFGRGWKAFSRKNQLHSLMEGTSLADRRTALLERQPGILEALSNDGTGEYRPPRSNAVGFGRRPDHPGEPVPDSTERE